MNTKRTILTLQVRRELAGRLSALAGELQISRSELMRALIERALDASREDALAALQREVTFGTVALDGLLKSHPDANLRKQVHEAYHSRLGKKGLGHAA